jgi:hypothetical protein
MPTSSTSPPPDGPLEPIRAHKDALQEAAIALESSLAEPSTTVQWRDGVRAALRRAQQVLGEHIAETDGPAGLPASVVDSSPRLAGPARRLASEHDDLLERQQALASYVADDDVPPELIRDAAAEMAAMMLQHVRHAQDLIVDAVEEELGAGD